jgi:hypothetical protein
MSRKKLGVYLAGAWADMHRLRERRADLVALGLHVTSRWMDQIGRDYSATTPEFKLEAKKDYEDIDRASFLIIDTMGASRGGREWEAGYATGRGKRVVRVGPIVTPFHSTVNLGFETWNDCLLYFAQALEHADERNN